MKLTKQDQLFRNPRICHIDPKSVDLDRILINLYMLLKNNGTRPVAKSGRKLITIDRVEQKTLALTKLIADHSDKLRGFNDYPDITRRWLESDLLDIVYRGNTERELIASPRPIHLLAYRLRNPAQCRDYNVADLLYAMITHGNRDLLRQLTIFLGDGVDSGWQRYNERLPLDLDTLFVLRLATDQQVQDDNAGEPKNPPEPPLCIGQARLMCDDIQRLLMYKKQVPRHVLISYLRTIIGFHVGLYMLKLYRLLPGWVNTRQITDGCEECQCAGANRAPNGCCRYRLSLLVDMGSDHRTRMAELSRASAEAHYARSNDYIRAVFAVNQLLNYARDLPMQTRPKTVAEAIRLLDQRDTSFDAYFRVRVNNLFPMIDDQSEVEEKPEVQQIRDMDLSPFDKYIELIAFDRTDFHRPNLVRLVDALLQKNQESGAMIQGKAKANGRRFHLGSRLLETLTQIAVLEPVGSLTTHSFRSRALRIDQFIQLLQERYGLVMDGAQLPEFANAGIRDYDAFRDNVTALKERLREIGFFTDLSDAYNAQIIRPRYPIDS